MAGGQRYLSAETLWHRRCAELLDYALPPKEELQSL